jgi:hypothetical protein
MKSSIFWDRTLCGPLKVKQSSLLPASRWFLLGLFFNPQDGSYMFIRNVCWPFSATISVSRNALLHGSRRIAQNCTKYLLIARHGHLTNSRFFLSSVLHFTRHAAPQTSTKNASWLMAYEESHTQWLNDWLCPYPITGINGNLHIARKAAFVHSAIHIPEAPIYYHVTTRACWFVHCLFLLI